MAEQREKTVPHPRKEPRYQGPLTVERLEEIFAGCVDFTRRTAALEGESACTLTLCYLCLLYTSPSPRD